MYWHKVDLEILKTKDLEFIFALTTSFSFEICKLAVMESKKQWVKNMVFSHLVSAETILF